MLDAISYIIYSVQFAGAERQKIMDSILENKPKPPSPKIDPRTGFSMDINSALRIDHDPRPQPPVPPMFNSNAMLDPGGIGMKPPANSFMPPNNMEQTPNHSDPGYLSTPGSGSFHGNSMGGNQFNNSNSQFNMGFGGNSSGFGGRNQFGGKGGLQFGNTPSSNSFSSTPGMGSYGNTPSGNGSFGGTPMSYDSGVPSTPITPQTPQPPGMKNDFGNTNENNNRNRGRNFHNRDRRDSYNNRDNNRERRDSYNSYNRDNRETNSYNRDRNKDNEYNRRRNNNDWNRDRHGRDRDRNDRDRNWRDRKNERDDWGRDRDRNRHRDRGDRNRNEYSRDPREESSNFRNKSSDHSSAYPPPPQHEDVPAQAPVYTPPAPKPPPVISPPPVIPLQTPPAEAKEEEDTRSMSLDSRIQSLLSGFKSPEPARPKTPPMNKPHVDDRYSSPHDVNNSQMISTNGSIYPSDIPIPPAQQDDDDRMSLDSNGSAGEPGAIEVTPADTSVPPPPLIPSQMPNSGASVTNWQQQNDLSSSNYLPGYMNNYPTGTFNQNFVNQFSNDLNNQRFDKLKMKDPQEEADKHEVTFNEVLENFVKELKEIMTKDLCKKMVETSAFKSYEQWWDNEEQKLKVHL